MDFKFTKLDQDQTIGFTYKNTKYYKLNMTVLEVFKTLGVRTRNDIYEKLMELGMEMPFMIMGTEEDVLNDIMIDALFPGFDQYIGPEEDKKFYNEVVNFVLNSVEYIDIPFEENGKWGLKCTSGKLVVPPIFEECKGARDFSYHNTLCAVKRDNKWWLTPRDGSGRICSLGYDSMSRSNIYVWVKKNGKKGLLDSMSGEPKVPCIMDWMANGNCIGNWFIGKDDKIGMISGAIGQKDDTNYIFPEYDSVDLSTGQFIKGDKRGWVLKDGTFTETPPRTGKDFYCPIFPNYPFAFEASDKYYNITELVNPKNLGILGEKDRSRRYSAKSMLKLPELSESDFNLNILEDLLDIYARIKHSIEANKSIEIPILQKSQGVFTLYYICNTNIFSIIWEETDEMNIAVDQAFPMIDCCHRYLKVRNNKPWLTTILEVTSEKFDLAMKFLSALINFRDVCVNYNAESWTRARYAKYHNRSIEEMEGYMSAEELREKLNEDIKRIYELGIGGE